MEIKRDVNRAEVEALLVGVPLPATRRQLLEYARRQGRGGEAAVLLGRIPEREYRSLPEVGETLEPRDVPAREERPPSPRGESGPPPGGNAYVGEREEPANVVAARGGGGQRAAGSSSGSLPPAKSSG